MFYLKIVFFSSDPFLYLAFTGLSDGTAMLLGIPAVEYLPRKYNIGGGSLTAGLLILFSLAVPHCKFFTKSYFEKKIQ